MTIANDQLAAWDRDAFLHPSTPYGAFSRGEMDSRIIETGDGVYITDRDGRRLLDGFAGLYCVNVGYGRMEIADAIAEQARKLAYYHAYAGHGTEASIRLAHMIMERAPAGMAKVYFGLGGSDANETNVKIAWYVNEVLGRPARKKIISRERAYHGSGLMTGSLSGLSLFHRMFGLPLDQVRHTHAPYPLRRPDPEIDEAAYAHWCAAELEALILREDPNTIAAFIAEPVIGTGGIVPPPAGYWAAIQEVLRKYDILLIVDEVVTGFGRLGTMFGSDHFGIKPDMITIAKGLTSAYAPLSGSIVSDRISGILEEGTDKIGAFGHGWTYSAHPIGAAAGIANLELIDTLGLVDNAGRVGPYLTEKMRAALGDHPAVLEVRGEGLLTAIEFGPPAAGGKRPLGPPSVETMRGFDPKAGVLPKLVQAIAREGVIARPMPQSDILGYAPPLCLSEAEADTIVAATVKAVEAFDFPKA